MRIDSIDIYYIALPLKYPFRTACGDDVVNESVLVRLGSESLYGWGEAASGSYPNYSPECASCQFIISRDYIAPILKGKDIRSGRELQSILSDIKGNQFAKAAFDLAWWDLHAKKLYKPLWKVLNGTGPVVDSGADIGILDTIDRLTETIQSTVDDGYKRVKLKCRPGWDIDVVDAIRATFPDITMHIDCNSAYTLQDTGMFKKLDRYNLAMIEQPLSHDDLIDHAALQTQIATPICLDESITTPDKARKAIQIGACRWINIKPGRVGGITPALSINDICRDAGIPCWIGGMLESAIGEHHCIALATLPNIKYPSDIFPTCRFYEKDVTNPPLLHSAPSQFAALPEPGIGIEPDKKLLERFIVDRISIRK
ncbi:MAG: o-succinylbenzoate synthase [Candidatus Latescibacteria bacterium]|nr:o-succinylbenzoate synthase [Candidatus Latescibacterota bacterium]